jgi:hypothetical protein
VNSKEEVVNSYLYAKLIHIKYAISLINKTEIQFKVYVWGGERRGRDPATSALPWAAHEAADRRDRGSNQSRSTGFPHRGGLLNLCPRQEKKIM